MSTQPRSDLKSTVLTSVSRNAMNPFGAKDLTALAATLSPVGLSAREALIATVPYRQSEFREDLAEYVCAAPWATDNAAIAAGHFKAPTSALKAAGLRSRTALRGKPRTSEARKIWQAWKGSPAPCAERAIGPKPPVARGAPCWLEPTAICANH